MNSSSLSHTTSTRIIFSSSLLHCAATGTVEMPSVLQYLAKNMVAIGHTTHGSFPSAVGQPGRRMHVGLYELLQRAWFTSFALLPPCAPPLPYWW